MALRTAQRSACGWRAVVLLLAVVATSVALSLPVFAHTAEEEQLCMNDAFRLCSAEIPDESRVAACMARQKNLLSPGCRALFVDPVPQASANPAGPVRLQSAPAVKRKKVKKPARPS